MGIGGRCAGIGGRGGYWRGETCIGGKVVLEGRELGI